MLRTLKRLLHPLIHTPLHPQWLLDERTHVVRLLKQYHVPGAVLDVGCGDAWAKRLIGNGETYIGLDYPETAIKEYGTRPDIFGDAHQLPFDSNLFQNVWLLDVLEHLADPQRVLAEAARVVAPGGRVFMQIPFMYPLHDEPRDYQRLTCHGLLRLAQMVNLKVIEIISTGHPLRTTCLMMNLALSKSMLNAIQRRRPEMLLVPLLPILILLLNLAGVLLGWIGGKDDTMPFNCQMVLEKS